jgi:hypothetical protein
MRMQRSVITAGGTVKVKDHTMYPQTVYLNNLHIRCNLHVLQWCTYSGAPPRAHDVRTTSAASSYISITNNLSL